MNEQIRLVNIDDVQFLEIVGELPEGFHGTEANGRWFCTLTQENAQALRQHMAWTAPSLVGLRKSIGCGDRLGIATLGHLASVRSSDMFPVLAQQSIREMDRAGRTPQQVLDDVTWAVFRADYRQGYGCDADHLKNIEVIDAAIQAGFIGFTLDPSDYVDNDAQSDNLDVLKEKYTKLNWDQLLTTPEAQLARYLGNSPVGEVGEEALYRAACKYGNALAHTASLARHIHDELGNGHYDLEVSVDETNTPTSPVEHYFIAAELMRLGVTFHGLAPRFLGRFEKGVDYIGDLGAFETDFAKHATIARELGPYKLSIHSGSDKFSIYPIIAEYANPYIHLKTAGTSWLEALRVIARNAPALMQEMLTVAIEQYPIDRASYHVSAEIREIPAISNESLEVLLNDFHARQILHVTFGTLLSRFRESIYDTLKDHLAEYHTTLHRHFDRHIRPFVQATQ